MTSRHLPVIHNGDTHTMAKHVRTEYERLVARDKQIKVTQFIFFLPIICLVLYFVVSWLNSMPSGVGPSGSWACARGLNHCVWIKDD